MTRRKLPLLAVLCGLLCWSGCEADPARELPHYDDANPLPLESALLYLDYADEDAPQALVVDIRHERPRMAKYALPAGAVRSYARPGSLGKQAVVLTGGRDARIIDGKARDAVSSHLVVFDRAGELSRTELPGRFQELTISADGRFAVAYGPTAGLALADAVAIVDLARSPAEARNVRLSDATGQPITSFEFSEGGPRLLVARGTDRLQIVELEHLDRRPKSVDLKLPGDTRQLAAGEVIFHGAKIYVAVENSSDVLQLELVASGEGSEAFTIAPLQLATDSAVRDIDLLVDDGEATVVALGDNTITLLEPVTGSGLSTPVPFGFTNLLPFRARSPLDDQVRDRALLLQQAGSQIAFVDFDDGSAWAQQSVETLWLDDTVARFVPDVEHGLVLLIYATGGLGLVDLEQRTVSPIATHAGVTSTLLDVAGEEARLWLTLDDGRIGHVDLLRLSVSEVLLNAPAQDLLIVEGKERRVAAIHDAASGYVTLLDPEQPSRESARELAGFLYSQIFD